ncbi:class I SAM-dependent methyltransferase [Thalassomonas sp. RHCl1]|uniref:class I SAM-dependent methyltransferase n=1 Tax=Thalassomonas sp. RHCl1 TaxID=2995320 RepID=UPI00248CFF5C|nr:class I SAM-dependent methyltransferase [Thalassomonas sp. RHCl1]
MKLKNIALFLASASILSAATIHAHTQHGHSLADKNYEANFAKVLQQESRPEADRKRDAGRKPQKVMQFAGIKPGMKVLDMVASGGYYTEVLSHRVGPSGQVLAHNNNFILTVLDGRFNKEITKRLQNNRLKNVTRFEHEFGDFNLNNEIDAATMMLNYHDLYGQEESKRKAVLAELKQALKPGGIFVVIDMEANPGKHNPKLHRIQSSIVKKEILAAGFELEKEGNFLRNPDDDHTKMVFDPSIRGKTDRFVFVFKKST